MTNPDELTRLRAENSELRTSAREQAKVALIERNRADELQRKLDEAVGAMQKAKDGIEEEVDLGFCDGPLIEGFSALHNSLTSIRGEG